MKSRLRCIAPLVLAVAALFLLSFGRACAEYAVFSDSFDDGNWTSHPKWEYSQTGPVVVTGERSVSAPYSLKVGTSNALGAIKAYSGLSSTSQSYTCTFNIFVESMGDEGIPWCLQTSGGGIVAILFLMPAGTVQLCVSDSAGSWTNTTSTAPNVLTYGEWHSFRLTYEGSTTSFYMDGHTSPDASVTQPYLNAPRRICVGNFSLPHTSTYFLDDLRITGSAPPARVYVQMCSDTSTNGISTSSHYMTFPNPDWSYSSPDGQAAQVMAESFRDAHRDSLGNRIRFTWYMLVGSLYAYGTTTGPLLPLELMQDYHGDEIEQWGDELAYHYHTWIWSDPDGDTVYHWNQAPDFTSCVDDFEQTVARMILDRSFYPSSFRSGWHWMDNFFQSYLDDWFPYRFENDYPNVRTETVEPIDNVYDWSRAPSAWAPYHPDPNDYQSPGSLRGWDSRSRYLKSLTSSQIEDAFLQALAGNPQLMTLFSHLKEADFPTQVANTDATLADMHDRIPTVEFEYLTGRECMLKWRNGVDATPPSLEITTSDSGGIRTATITSSEPIYQKQPFAARAGLDGSYERLECAPAGENRWTFQFAPDDTLRAAVAVTDWFGNPRVQFLRMPLRILNVSTTVTSDSAEITWETSNPADTVVDCGLAPSGPLTRVSSAKRVIAHKVSLAGLLPGQVYGVRLSSSDEFGQNAQSDEMYLLTKLAEGTVIDNVNPGFSIAGTWSTGSTAAGRYGTDYRYASTSPSGAYYAYWTWQAPQAQECRVYAWWSQGANRSTQAKYSVFHDGEEYTNTINQQADGGKWNDLGVYSASAGDTIQVRLSNNAPSGYVVIADAVKFEPAYTPLSSPGLAKLLPDGTAISFSDAVVTAVFGPEFYAEALSRSSGIKVEGSGVTVKDIVQICGDVQTSSGERIIRNAIVKKPGGTAEIEPLGVTNRDLSLDGGRLLSTAGMLVRIWGKVRSVGSAFFYIDDGSGLTDPTGSIGVRIDSSALSTPPDDPDYAIVTGIPCLETLPVGGVPIIRPRDAGDFLILSP